MTTEPHLLRGLGSRFAVDRTADGPEALELLRRHPGRYALVLVSVRMPSTRADVFLAESRRVAPSTPRIVLAGWADTDAARHAVRTGLAARAIGMPCGGVELLRACEAELPDAQVVPVAFGDGHRAPQPLAA